MSDPTTVKVAELVQPLIDERELKQDIGWSPTDLTSAMMNQASLFVSYGVKAAKATRQVSKMKLLLETKEAAVYRKLRDTAAASGEKVTEAQLEKAVAMDVGVRAIKRAMNKARYIEDVCKTAVEAFRHRREMLVNEGFRQQQEMKGEVSISARREVDQQRKELEQRVITRTTSKPQM